MDQESADSHRLKQELAATRRSVEALRLSRDIFEAAARHSETIGYLTELVEIIKEFAGCQAAGIRILDELGNIPYLAFEGFSREFYQEESPLCISRDGCFCVQVIRGQIDASQECLTAGGSFHAKDTRILLESLSNGQKTNIRGACLRYGYRSLALVPIRAQGEIYGLVHLADSLPDQIQRNKVEILEEVAAHLGIAIQRCQAQEASRKQEDWLKQLTDALPAYISYVDRDRRFRFNNQAYEKTFNTTREDAYGRYIWEVLGDNAYQSIKSRVDSALSGHAVQYESMLPLPGGDRWVRANYIPHVGATGELEGFFVLANDVTAERESKLEQRKSAATLEGIFRAAPIGIGIVHNRVLGWTNEALTRITGYSSEELQGQDARMLYPDDAEYQRVGREKYAEIKQKGTGSIETRFKTKDGRFVNVLLSSTPINSRDLSAGVVFTVQDMTEIHEAQTALNRERDLAATYLEVAGVMMVAIDSSGTVTMINKKGSEILGYPEEEIVGRNWFEDFLPEENRKQVREVFDLLMTGKTEVAEYFENSVATRNGDNRLIAWHNVVLEDPSGKISGTLSSGEDITLRRWAEREIRESEFRLREAQRLGRIGSYEYDVKTQKTTWSDQVFHLYGMDPSQGEPVKEDLQTLYYPETAQEIRNVYQKVIETGDEANLDLHVKTVDGQSAYQHCRIVPVKNDQGEIVKLIGTLQDITERTQLQAQLAQSDRLASVGMLAAGVAHEINNPLAYVLYNLQSLLGDLESGPPEDLIARVREATEGAERIRGIVRDLKTFSPVDEDFRSPVQLPMVIEAAANMAFNEIKYRARLVKDFQSTGPVLVNEGRLSQVFLNLLVNAAQSIEEGDVANNEIRVRTWSEKDEEVAEVSDTGKGISAESLDHVFDPFYSTKPVGVGSGLGLFICHNIIESYGGKLEVESEVGVGTRVRVRLPVYAPDQVQEPLTAANPEPASAPMSARILIIDDEAGIRSSIHRLLKTEHTTMMAESGKDGLEIIEKDQTIDLIICDLMMPRMSGMDLFDWLQRSQPELGERVIFITGGAFTPRAAEFVRQIPNPLVEKPFDAFELRSLINQRLTMLGPRKSS